MKRIHFTNNLAYSQLGHAADMLAMSRHYRETNEQPYSWILAERYAISSILHAYSGFESVVNGIGFELFFDQESFNYIEKKDRNLPLQGFIKSWSYNLPIVKRFKYIIEAKNVNAEGKLLNELQELNNLRNWLVHGFSFGTTVLLKPNERGTYDEVNREDTVDWSKKFPITKFNPIDRIDHQDAVTAMRIVLECLKILVKATSKFIPIPTYYGGVNHFIVTENRDVSELLQK